MTKYKYEFEIELKDPRCCNGCPFHLSTDVDTCSHNSARLNWSAANNYESVYVIRDKDCPLSMVDEYAKVEKESLREYERFTE